MENGLTTTGGNQVANYGKNVFETFGEAAEGQRSIVGDLLKFDKGDWLAGQDNKDVPAGTKLIAVMDSITWGWVRWEDGRPAEQRMELVVSGIPPAKRQDLGHDDKSKWETDAGGKPMDPWRNTIYLILVDPKTKAVYTFATSSWGGRGAIGQLSKTYGAKDRENKDTFPLISLGSSFFNTKEYGRVKKPVFQIEDWTTNKSFALKVVEGTASSNEGPNDIPFDTASKLSDAVAAVEAGVLDDIPPHLDRRTKSGKSPPRF